MVPVEYDGDEEEDESNEWDKEEIERAGEDYNSRFKNPQGPADAKTAQQHFQLTERERENRDRATLGYNEHLQNQKAGNYISKDDIVNIKIAIETLTIDELIKKI